MKNDCRSTWIRETLRTPAYISYKNILCILKRRVNLKLKFRLSLKPFTIYALCVKYIQGKKEKGILAKVCDILCVYVFVCVILHPHMPVRILYMWVWLCPWISTCIRDFYIARIKGKSLKAGTAYLPNSSRGWSWGTKHISFVICIT